MQQAPQGCESIKSFALQDASPSIRCDTLLRHGGLYCPIKSTAKELHPLWKVFAVLENGRAICMLCDAEYAYMSIGRGTTNLLEHIQKHHPVLDDQLGLKQARLDRQKTAVPLATGNKSKAKSADIRNLIERQGLSNYSDRADLLFTRMMASTLSPLRLGEDQDFRDWVEHLTCGKWTPPYATTARKRLREYHQEIVRKLRDELKMVPFAITTDGWSQHSTHYCGLTVHWIDAAFVLHSQPLGLFESNGIVSALTVHVQLCMSFLSPNVRTEQQTAKQIAQNILEAFRRLELVSEDAEDVTQSGVVAAVTDEGANYKAAIQQELMLPNPLCVDHRIHTCLKHAIGEVRKVSASLSICMDTSSLSTARRAVQSARENAHTPEEGEDLECRSERDEEARGGPQASL